MNDLLDNRGFLNFRFKSAEDITDEVTVDRLNAMVDATNQNNIVNVVGGYFAAQRRGKSLVCNKNGAIVPPPTFRPFFGTDASAGGANGLISFTAGTVTDLTNSSTVWTGTTGPKLIYMADYSVGSVPFALALTGPPIRQPALQLNAAATCAYLSATVDATTGFITAYSILADSGLGMPASTNVLWNAILTSLSVTITGGVASVQVYNDGAYAPLYFRICGLLPLVDGTAFTVGT